jgi:hypothetical protein
VEALIEHLRQHEVLAALLPPVERIMEEGMVQTDAIAAVITKIEELMTSQRMQKDYLVGLLKAVESMFAGRDRDELLDDGESEVHMKAARLIDEWGDAAGRVSTLIAMMMKAGLD